MRDDRISIGIEGKLALFPIAGPSVFTSSGFHSVVVGTPPDRACSTKQRQEEQIGPVVGDS
jgi:hypothetical protein